jgi:hypothetical protein
MRLDRRRQVRRRRAIILRFAAGELTEREAEADYDLAYAPGL